VVRRRAARLLARCPEPEAAVLGCTHYPIAAPAFRAALPQGIEILSQPDIVAASLADYLARHPRFAGGAGHLRLLTSGEPAGLADAAARLIGRPAAFAPA
jgi:glutamate racemase